VSDSALYHRDVLLYAITDRRLLAGSENERRSRLVELARGWARGGVDFIQIREKDLAPDELLALTRQIVAAVRADGAGTRVLLNGPPKIALEAGADGIHLPGNASADAALVVRELYARAGREIVMSRACHSATEAAQGDAGLLLYAPVFEKVLPGEKALPGESIPGRGLAALAEACRAAGDLPVLALGGITVENAVACIEAGARGVAAIRLFLGAEWWGLRSL
jgi:thiamine-phosphate pyrophosphorylase